jgi:alpha-D-xyloside xylohydrolase
MFGVRRVLRARRAALLVPVLAVTGTASLAPAAGAEVIIGPDRIEVGTERARAVLERSPVRLTVQDETGRAVLVQSERRQVPRSFTSYDEEPFGAERLKDAAGYAPFVYEVGSARRQLWTTSHLTGNILWSFRRGRYHAAQAVEQAVQEGDGVRATLSTTEPGRKLVVRIGPDPLAPTGVRVRVTPTPGDGVIAMGDAFRSGTDERFYGFGARHNSMNQRGEALSTWINDQPTGTGVFKGTWKQLAPAQGEKYLTASGQHGTHYPQSLFVSSRPYGFFLDNDEIVRWRMAADHPDAWHVSAAGRSLDYTVVTGAAGEAMRQITQINGRHRLPPAWAQRPSLLRISGVSDWFPPRSGYERKVRNDLAEIEKRKPPIGSYAVEGWARFSPESLQEVRRRLAALDIRMMLYLRGYVSADTAGVEPRKYYYEAKKHGYLIPDRRTGNPVLFGTGYGTPGGLIDFTNPAAVRWWEGRVIELLELGASGFMLDFGEQVVDNMRFHDGRTGAQMHNAYPALMHKITREIADRWSAENPERGPIFIYTRTGSSGRQGAAAHEMANFPGDWTSDWSLYGGLGGQTKDMLNRAVGGAWGFVTDIGGLYDFVTPPLSKELFIRWSQWAALTTFHRLHNSSTRQVRMPWSFDEEAYRLWEDSARLHDRAVPLIQQLWKDASEGGLPPLRPMWLAAPDDPAAGREEQAWMLGDNVLVAPVVTKGARTRRINLPSGCWTYAGDGRDYEGRREVTVPAPLSQLPYFTRCGTTPFDVNR